MRIEAVSLEVRFGRGCGYEENCSGEGSGERAHRPN
jgi:hypothetical protein